jgi:hypothetical protein
VEEKNATLAQLSALTAAWSKAEQEHEEKMLSVVGSMTGTIPTPIMQTLEMASSRPWKLGRRMSSFVSWRTIQLCMRLLQNGRESRSKSARTFRKTHEFLSWS